MTDLLVIGYGNDLRRDDGAGRQVAEAVEELALPGVVVRSVAQLTPELALDIAGATGVVFVDADVDATAVTAEAVTPSSTQPGVMTHHGDPVRLLALVATVGRVPDRAVAISIPARDLGLGTNMSPEARAGVARAIELITTLATQPPDA